jgi:hypothetical protein
LIAGGRVGRLPNLGLRATGVFVAAAAIRVALIILGVKGSPVASSLTPWLFLATYLALLLALWLNRHLRPVLLIALGIVLNLAVIATNQGAMPVDRGLAVRSGSAEMVRMLDSPTYLLHRPISAQTRLRPLADVLPLPLLYPRPKFFCPGSVGDVFITIGACALLLLGLGAFGLGKERGL